MEFVSARELRLDPKGVWRKIGAKSISVVTINGKPQFLLTKLHSDDLEEVIYIQNRIRAELALKKMREHAAQKGLDQLGLDEINEIIRKARKSHKK